MVYAIIITDAQKHRERERKQTSGSKLQRVSMVDNQTYAIEECMSAMQADLKNN